MNIAIIAGAISFIGFIPYVYSIIKGETQPNRATWIIWALVGTILAFSYHQEGDPNTIWLPLSYAVGPFVIAVLSLFYGEGGFKKLDIFCFAAAIIGLIPFLYSGDALLTLYIYIFIDLAGALPTFVKVYKDPLSEDILSWLFFLTGNALNLLAIEKWNEAAFYPIYLLLMSDAVIILSLMNNPKTEEQF
jgi:hypothetical protein